MVLQEEKLTCGNACIRNILIILKKDKSYSTYFINSSCDSFSKIKNELNQNNIYYTGYKINDFKYIERKHLPAIMQIYNGTNYHFVILYSINNRYAKIIDPQYGKLIIKLNKLKEISTGNFLLLDSYKKDIAKKTSLQFINFKQRLLYYFLSIFQLISLTIFYNSIIFNYQLIYKIITGIVSIVFILLHNLLNIYIRKRLNKIIEIYSFDAVNKDDVISLSNATNNEISIISNTLSYLVAILFCIYILSNSIFELIIIIFPIISFLYNLKINPKINNLKRENSHYEDIAFSFFISDKDKYFYYLKIAKKSAYKTFLFKIIPYILLITFLSSYLFIDYLLLNNLITNKFIFYIFMSFTIYSCLNKVYLSIFKKVDTYTYLNKMKLSIKSFSFKNKIIYYNNIDNILEEKNE